jgi:hypothetical protein
MVFAITQLVLVASVGNRTRNMVTLESWFSRFQCLPSPHFIWALVSEAPKFPSQISHHCVSNNHEVIFQAFPFGLSFDGINSWSPCVDRPTLTNPESINLCTSRSKKWVLVRSNVYSQMDLSMLAFI